MDISIAKVPLAEIQSLRQQYLIEQNCQIRYDACHSRNWADEYLIYLDNKLCGYVSVKGRDDLMKRDAIFEIYIIPSYRAKISEIYRFIIEATSVKYLECQTNDLIHSPLLQKFGRKIKSPTILFADDFCSQLQIADAIVRPRREGDHIFEKNREAGAYVLLVADKVVASGGFLLHYNQPFADLYMEAKADQRRKGYASYLLQEIKKICYQAGRVPAARCSAKNVASKATLLKAGMRVCGHMLTAEVKLSSDT